MVIFYLLPLFTSILIVVETPAAVVHHVAAKGRVGILIAGEIENDFLKDAIAKALAEEQIVEGNVVSTIENHTVLPYAAQALSKFCDVVIAVAIIIGDESGAITASLHNALLQVGVNGSVPIVPALVTQSSLLEAKALLPQLAAKWAQAARSILSLGVALAVNPAPQHVVEEKPVISAAVDSADKLLEIFTESLKVWLHFNV